MTGAPALAAPPPVVHTHPAARAVQAAPKPKSKPRRHVAPVRRHKPEPVITNRTLTKLLSHSALPASAPLPTHQIAFVPAQGVTLVPPTEVPGLPSADLKTTRSATTPPKAPTLPPAPSSPANDVPASFAGGLSSAVGGALLLVAALAAVLLIIPPWVTSRVALASATPFEWHRRLSLERPG